MKAFHDHLDTCPVCANQPFGLCPVGLKLLLAAAVPTIEHDVPVSQPAGTGAEQIMQDLTETKVNKCH